MSNDDKVLLDLNVPMFEKKLFELDAGEVKKVFKTFQKLQMLSWNDADQRDINLAEVVDKNPDFSGHESSPGSREWASLGIWPLIGQSRAIAPNT